MNYIGPRRRFFNIFEEFYVQYPFLSTISTYLRVLRTKQVKKKNTLKSQILTMCSHLIIKVKMNIMPTLFELGKLLSGDTHLQVQETSTAQ